MNFNTLFPKCIVDVCFLVFFLDSVDVSGSILEAYLSMWPSSRGLFKPITAISSSSVSCISWTSSLTSCCFGLFFFLFFHFSSAALWFLHSFSLATDHGFTFSLIPVMCHLILYTPSLHLWPHIDLFKSFGLINSPKLPTYIIRVAFQLLFICIFCITINIRHCSATSNTGRIRSHNDEQF